MIKKFCDRCGNARFPIHRNAIDSLEVSLKKKAKEPKENSRGELDGEWRVRLCPVSASLCRKCCIEIVFDGSVGVFAHEGDYAPEVYELVQTPEEAKVYRFRKHAEYEIAMGSSGSFDCATLASLEYKCLYVLPVDGTLEDALKGPVWNFWRRFLPEQRQRKAQGLPYFKEALGDGDKPNL